jgi:hypothetical protein
MKRLIAGLAVILVLPVLFAGCSRVNPGPTTTRNFDYAGFDNVEVSSSFEVELVQSATYSVTITAQEKLFDQISLTKAGGTLQINLQWGWGTWVSSWGYQRPKARITMPELYELKLSGASKGSATGFRSSHDTNVFLSGASSLEVDFELAYGSRIEVSGASRLNGKVRATDIRLQIDGASSADLSGSVAGINLEASGASRANLEDLSAEQVSVELSGASRATVSPKDKMRVNISGASSLTYTGSPSLESIEVSGASTIHKK